MIIPINIRETFLNHIKSSQYHTDTTPVQVFEEATIIQANMYSPFHKIYERNELRMNDKSMYYITQSFMTHDRLDYEGYINIPLCRKCNHFHPDNVDTPCFT